MVDPPAASPPGAACTYGAPGAEANHTVAWLSSPRPTDPTITVPSCQLVAALAWLSTCGPVSAVARQERPSTELQTVAVLLPVSAEAGARHQPGTGAVGRHDGRQRAGGAAPDRQRRAGRPRPGVGTRNLAGDTGRGSWSRRLRSVSNPR